jgi:uncharacterized protein YebE (UPF0316 family)
MQAMSKNTTYQGQSFFDKVIECTGSIENVFAMALLNGISITDDLPIEQYLAVSEKTNNVIVSFFDENNKPATAITAIQIEEIESVGIGKMIIATDFIVR